ncbi:hypothetical protein M5689_005227 [Euphorbia peplus]|nr:hypothetical protein M5689_005227 [Euphorbia peplus]
MLLFPHHHNEAVKVRSCLRSGCNFRTFLSHTSFPSIYICKLECFEQSDEQSFNFFKTLIVLLIEEQKYMKPGTLGNL